MAVDDMYLENLEEFVIDENKVVTYKWLSKTLSVHVNQAKQMLYTFAKKQSKSKSPVCVTYLVCGKQETKDGICIQKVTIVREDELEAAKSRLDKVSSVHVYSVQKSQLRNSDVLYTTDYDITKENLQDVNKFSAIHCSQAKPRSQKDLEKLAKTASTTPTSSSTHKQTTAVKKSSDKKVESENSTVTKPTIKEETKPASKKGKAGIADMFSRAKTKGKPKEEQKEGDGEKTDSKDEKQNKSASKPKVKGVGAFFEKTVPKKEEKHEPKDSPEPEEKPKEEKKPTKKVKTPPAKSKKRQPIKTVVSDSDEEIEEQPKKKRRRRVKEMSDSSDEDMVVDSPVVPPSPSPPPSPVKEDSPNEMEHDTSGGQNKRKKRVLKSKTFMDDEGCMVTEKVWEEESIEGSEPEDNVPKKSTKAEPQKAQQSKKKISPPPKKKSPTKSKQASLMSFFKKK